MKRIDEYEILGLQGNESVSEIKKKYHQLARKYHPDRNNANSKNFYAIAEAYQALTDPDTKQDIDALRGTHPNFATNIVPCEESMVKPWYWLRCCPITPVFLAKVNDEIVLVRTIQNRRMGVAHNYIFAW